MNNKKIIVKGSGGGGGGESTSYVPVEAENSLQANTYAKLVDLLGEGEIGGPANGDSWYKSTYLMRFLFKMMMIHIILVVLLLMLELVHLHKNI